MAYTVLCDGLPIHDLRDDSLLLIDPVVTLADNESGFFEFSISPKHPNYSNIKKLKSVIQVFHNETEIFCGRPLDESKDFHNCKNFYCEGELAYFVDSIQRPAEYHNQIVRDFLETLVSIHNQQVEESKRFVVGQVTVTDSNDSLYRYTNYENTLTCIKEKLINKLGGHIRIRKVNGVRYIDYLADYPNTNTQVIEFGKNLLDFSQSTTAGDIATAIIPLGAKLEESSIAALEEYLTIKSVNNNIDYVYNATAVNNFGWIFKTVKFDSVTKAENLRKKGLEYLNDVQYETLVLEVNAVDLHLMNVEIERINLLDRIRVLSKPHGLDKYFPVTKMTVSLSNPENDTITLGSSQKTLTSATASNNSQIAEKFEGIAPKSEILAEAKKNATQLITDATNGFVVLSPNELLVMDTDDKETASKVWRWNVNGLGYSKDGYDGEYGLAMTMDGALVADFITVGSLRIGGNMTIESPLLENQKRKFLFNSDGATLYNAKLELSGKNSNILLEPDLGIIIGQGSLVNIENGIQSINTENAKFWVDGDGNIHLKGVLEGASGRFSGDISGATGTFTGGLNIGEGQFVVDAEGNLTAEKGVFRGKIECNEGSFGGTLNAASGTFSGDISSATGTFSGALNVGEGKFSVDANGNVTTAGNVTLGGNITLSGNITWSAGSSPVAVLYGRSAYSKPTGSYDSYPASDSYGWHRTLNSSRDYYASYSYDGGQTWTVAMKVKGQDGVDGVDGADGQDGMDGSDAYVSRDTIVDALRTSSKRGDGIYQYYNSDRGEYCIGLSATYIRAGTIDAEIIALESGYGGFSEGYGSDGIRTTYGAMMYSSGHPYFIVTNKGCRMTANEEFYVADSSIVASTEIEVISDKRYKNSIDENLDKYEGFFKSLKPAMYKMNRGQSGRFHLGFIAQEVEQALHENNLTNMDFAGLTISQSFDEFQNISMERYQLRYSEFISLNTYMIQKLQKEIEELKRKVNTQ